jgi:hypothetical protein
VCTAVGSQGNNVDAAVVLLMVLLLLLLLLLLSVVHTHP